jgi:nucleoside-diphosphate-sugar epimerase
VKVVLTGATGFIGSHVLPLLVERGHEVAATTRGAPSQSAPGVTWVCCDVADPRFVELLPAAADAVVHLVQAVGSPPDDGLLRAVNVESTRLLIERANRVGVGRFLLASSGSVYGGSSSPLLEDEPLRPRDPYARSKADAEQLLDRAGADICASALRLFAPYGPGQQGRLIPDLVARVSEGRPVSLYAEGHPKLNPIFVDDVAAIVVGALEVPVPPVLNVAGDEILSIRDMATAIGRGLGVSPVFEEGEGAPPPDLVADTTLLHRTFELPELTPFERGIAATVAH